FGGECNQSCQQYRSDSSIRPKPATKLFLIFRIECSILIDYLFPHRTPPFLPKMLSRNAMPDYGFGRCDGHHEMVDFRLRKMTRGRKKAQDVPGLQVVSNKGEWPRGNEPLAGC